MYKKHMEYDAKQIITETRTFKNTLTSHTLNCMCLKKKRIRKLHHRFDKKKEVQIDFSQLLSLGFGPQGADI